MNKHLFETYNEDKKIQETVANIFLLLIMSIYNYRDVFRTLSKNCDRTFLRKYLMAKSNRYFTGLPTCLWIKCKKEPKNPSKFTLFRNAMLTSR